MKKEHVDFIVDSFIDYKDEIHKFVIVAISQSLPTKGSELNKDQFHSKQEVIHDVEIYVDNYGAYDSLGLIGKVVKIGIAICNPEDDFDEKIGYNKAYSRAKQNTPILYANLYNPGVINSEVIKALLRQEATYIKNNPSKYIKGYKESEKKYKFNERMMEMEENFSSLEDDVLDALRKDPNYFDDVYKYLKWETGQN